MKLSILVILVFLVSLSYPAPQQAIGQYTLPEYNRTVGYVHNLIDTYDALVKNSTYINRPDFDSIKENLSLYHDVGHSFQVVVLQSVPNNSDYVTLMFAPIRVDRPNVTMDYADTFSSLFPHAVVSLAEYAILERNALVYGNATIQLPLVFVVFSTDISGDYLTNAKSAAQFIFEQDAKQIPAHLIFKVTLTQGMTIGEQVSAQSTFTSSDPSFVTRYFTLTVTTTTTQTTTSQVTIVNNQTVIVVPATTYIEPTRQTGTETTQGQDLVMGIISNPISWVAGAASFAFLVLVAYFGSIREAIRFLVDKQERKMVEQKAAQRMKQLFRRKKKANKKEDQQQVKPKKPN